MHGDCQDFFGQLLLITLSDHWGRLLQSLHRVSQACGTRDAGVRWEWGPDPEPDRTEPRVRSGSGSGLRDSEFWTAVRFGVRVVLISGGPGPDRTPDLMI